MKHLLLGTTALALVGALASFGTARADDQTAQATQTPTQDQAAPTPPPHPTVNGVMFSGHIEAGSSFNPDGPNNNINFGQLFTDRANSFGMNQAMLTAEKDIDSTSANWDWGFKIQGMYGTDARYTHFFNEGDFWTHSPYQWDIVELNGDMHFPWMFGGGSTDVKVGQYSTPIGYEVIDATGNTFYTHSYIFNFGIPLKHTGIQTVNHVTDMLDIWAGVDTGVNASWPDRRYDNNGSLAILTGFGINNPIPNLTILGLAHIGPENPYIQGQSQKFVNGVGVLTPYDPNHAVRQIYDMVTTYKINDSWSVANEINFIRDDLAHATAEGAALYGSYAYDDQWTFSARGEVFRDDQGFFVAAFPASQDFLTAERGLNQPVRGGGFPLSAYGATGPSGCATTQAGTCNKATYSELTIGASYKPPLPPLPLGLGLTIRPEFRWDHAWGMIPNLIAPNGQRVAAHAFDVNGSGVATKDDQFLFSVDAIFGF